MSNTIKTTERLLITVVAIGVAIFVVSKIMHPAMKKKALPPALTSSARNKTHVNSKDFPSMHQDMQLGGIAEGADFDGIVPDPEGFMKGVQVLDAGWTLGRSGMASSRNMDLQLRREPRIPKVDRKDHPMHYSSIEHTDFDSKLVKYDIDYCNPPMGG